jgi:hypothetical protein
MRQDVKKQFQEGFWQPQHKTSQRVKSSGKMRKDEVVRLTTAINRVGENPREPRRYARIGCGLSLATWRAGERWPT